MITETSEKLRSTLTRPRAGSYLAFSAVTIVVAQLAQAWWPTESLFKGQSVSIWISLLSVPVLILLAHVERPAVSWALLTKVFLAILLLTWLYQFALLVVRHEAYNYSTFLFPITLVLLFWKPLSPVKIRFAANALAYSIVALVIAYLVLAHFNFIDPREEFPRRLPFLPDSPFGPWRWEGPFGNVNYSGPMGAYLAAYGLFAQGRSKWLFVATGLVMVIASESRGAFFAAFVALTFWLVARLRSDGRKGSTRALTWLLCLVPIGAIVVLLVKDPTLNGRTLIWREYIDLWANSPLWGVGNSGIDVALESAQVSTFATHGHSLVIQSMAVSGAVSVLLLLLLLIYAIRIGLSAARRGNWAGLALIAVFIICNLYEDLTSFGYMGVQVLPLIFGVLLASETSLKLRTG